MHLRLDVNEQWRQEIREEKIKVDGWERKFQEAQTRNEALKKTSLSKFEEMKRRVEELEAVLQNCEIRIELLEASGEH
ncbi:hypothetical protein Golob_011612 [Gossypium lobatum]|uniref:Uncharacterized protein n=1 Tax=Gossypium lobatum TaxID=34289 RepID=A0A7J8MQ32_9ROSI|nr:hypothetical protein [Gossypium lobatum]